MTLLLYLLAWLPPPPPGLLVNTLEPGLREQQPQQEIPNEDDFYVHESMAFNDDIKPLVVSVTKRKVEQEVNPRAVERREV